MISFVVVFAVLAGVCSIGIVGNGSSTKNDEKETIVSSLSPKETMALRGVAMLIIVYSHMADPGIRTTFFFYVSGALGVAICFFISGYGLGKGYHHKENYLSHFLPKKLLRVLMPYFVLYAVYALIAKPSWRQIIRELFTLRMAENLLWYLKVQLLLYIFFYCSYRLVKKEERKLLTLITGCIVYSLLLFSLHAETFWYKTCLFFPLGVWFSTADGFFLPLLRKKTTCIIFAFISFFMFAMIYFKGRMGMELLVDGIYMSAFGLFLVGLGSYFKESLLLGWIGKYSLEVYLLHCLILRMAGTYFPGTQAVSYLTLVIVVLLLSVPLEKISNILIRMLGRIAV